jgi:hypothetical protein
VAAVVVGHTPTREPKVRANVINVDTGLVYGGNLTLLRLDEIAMLLNRSARKEPALRRRLPIARETTPLAAAPSTAPFNDSRP